MDPSTKDAAVDARNPDKNKKNDKNKDKNAKEELEKHVQAYQKKVLFEQKKNFDELFMEDGHDSDEN